VTTLRAQAVRTTPMARLALRPMAEIGGLTVHCGLGRLPNCGLASMTRKKVKHMYTSHKLAMAAEESTGFTLGSRVSRREQTRRAKQVTGCEIFQNKKLRKHIFIFLSISLNNCLQKHYTVVHFFLFSRILSAKDFSAASGRFMYLC